MIKKLFQCLTCRKIYPFAEEDNPRFCPICGAELISLTAQKDTLTEDTKQTEIIRFAYGETTPTAVNTDFCDETGLRILTGWLPEGFSGYGVCSMHPYTPLQESLFSFAKHSDGREMFWQSISNRHENRNQKIQTNDSFRPLDAYLDHCAVSKLGTNNIRLLKRVASYEQTQNEIRSFLERRKLMTDYYNSQWRRQAAQYDYTSSSVIIQALYGEDGGKLYEAEKDGKRTYLLLQACIWAEERGILSVEENVSTPDTAVSSEIDTDPYTPFGQHRTDGLLQPEIRWSIIGYSGYQTDTLPAIDEIRDFYKYINSMKIAPEYTVLKQIQTEQIAKNNIIPHLFARQGMSMSRIDREISPRQKEWARMQIEPEIWRKIDENN